MILRVLRYAYGGAKVMALRGNLLSEQDYHFLLRASDPDDLLAYLGTTAHGPILQEWDWRGRDADAELSRRLYGSLVQDFVKVGRGLMRREARFIQVLAQLLVVENLKVVLRALYRGLPPEQAADSLLPLGPLTPLDFEELLDLGTPQAMVDRLADTLWGRALTRGLARYEREKSLFPLEMSLDLWVFEHIWEGQKHLSRIDQAAARRLLGVLADILNIVWAGRFRDLYGFEGEEIYQYLIAVGSFHRPEARRRLAFASDMRDMIANLPGGIYRELLSGAEDAAELHDHLTRYWLDTLRKTLRQAPFQIGLPIAYLFLKELEIFNLISIVTGRVLDLPAEKLVHLLKQRAVGDFYV